MAGNSVTVEAKLKDEGVVSGAKKIKDSLEDIKKADGSLKWDGVRDGAKAADGASDGFTVLKGALASLAANGVAMASGALKNLAASVVEVGMGFETSMSKVAALSGAAGAELEALEAKARELGAATTYSASEAADALGYMALAGWDTQQMLDGVGSVLTLAQAGEMDLAAASDLVTDYLSAFNMEAAETSRMVDVLAYAQANANTSVEGLGMAFKNCAANANAAGLDIETTSAAISMMANQGLKGSEAGTALNAVLRDMTAKMEDGAIAIGEQSVAVMDAEGNYRDFTDILADVGAATDGMGDAQKAAALQSTFTADSIKGLNLMLNAGADELAGFRDELYGSAGAGAEMAAVMTDNLGGDIAAMNSAFDELRLKIYDGLQAPLRAAVQFVTGKVVPAATVLMDNLDYVAMALGGVGAAVAALQFPKIASALSAVPKLLAGFTGGPVLTVVGALTALAAGAKWAYDNVEPFRLAVDELAAAVGGALGPVLDSAAEALGAALPAAAEGASSLLSGLVVPATEALATFLTGTVVPAVERFGAFLREKAAPAMAEMAEWAAANLVPAMGELASFLTGTVVPAVRDLAEWVARNVVPVLGDLAGFVAGTLVPALGDMARNVLGTLVPALSEAYGWFSRNILPALSQLASFIASSVLPALASVAEFLLANLVPALEGLVAFVSGALDVLCAAWEATWGVASSALEAAWSVMGGIVETAMAVIQGVIDTVTAAISGDWEGAWRGIGQTFAAVANGILSLGANAMNGLASTVGSIVTGLYNTWSRIWSRIYSTARSVWDSIRQAVTGTAGAIVSAVTGAFNGLASTVGSIFDKVAYAITHPIETAKTTIKGIVDAIKGFFSGFKISLPNIKLPHFSIRPSGWQIGDLLEGKIPSLGIDWYATGGVFASPRVIGIGEAGAEAVLPLTNPRAMRDVGEAIAGAGGGGGQDAMVEELRAIRQMLPRQIGRAHV